MNRFLKGFLGGSLWKFFLLKMDRKKKQQLDLHSNFSFFFITEILATKIIVPCSSIKVDCNPVVKEPPKTRIFRLLYIMNKSHVFSCEERQQSSKLRERKGMIFVRTRELG